LALKKKLLDNPNDRSLHTIPTPRGGGLAIVLTWLGGLVFLYLEDLIAQNLFYALVSGVVLAIVSLIDDIVDLKPFIRILAQATSAFLALYFIGGLKLMQGLDNYVILMIVNFVAFIGIIWFINLFNFLDGIDAYASQEAIFVALGILLITGNPLVGLLIAAVAGFLVWNWPKARIFMGDVGSTQLGFILIVLGIYFHNTIELNIASWLILTALFWVDATLTLFRRWRNHEKLSVAHNKHAYQRIVKYGFSHQKIVLIAIIINSSLLGLTYLSSKYCEYVIGFILFAIIELYIIIRLIDKRYPFDYSNEKFN
jgi:Fuc2NAc and GlcNAc transferase